MKGPLAFLAGWYALIPFVGVGVAFLICYAGFWLLQITGGPNANAGASNR